MPYVYITSFSGPPATIRVCDTATNTICYTYPTQLTDLGPFPYIINLPAPDFNDVGSITLTAQSINGCSIVQSDVCSILPTPSPTSAPVPCFEVVINGEFNTNLSGWSAESGPNQWVWDSFNGGSAFYPGEDDYLKLAQTGYTFLEGFNYTISYDIYSPDTNGGGFAYPILGLSQPDYPSGFPYPPLSAWTSYSYVLESNGDNTLKMFGFSNGGGVYLDNVSACFTYGPCYYMEFATNDNFSVSGTVDYVDCNGVLQTYTANTEGTFYLCAIQSPGSVDIDVVDYETYLCTDAGGGDWIPPYLESPTPTPSNPPTPTPSVTEGYGFYEVMYIGANVSANDMVSVGLQSISSQPVYINWGDGNVTTLSFSIVNFHTYSSPFNGNIEISAFTNTVGELPGITKFLFNTNSSSPTNANKYSVNTTEISKFVDAIEIYCEGRTFGTINDFSACTSLESLVLNWGTYSGNVTNLPNTIKKLWLRGNTGQTVTGNFTDLPTNIQNFEALGANTISGNVASLLAYPSLQSGDSRFIHYTYYSQGAVSGLCENLPNTRTIVFDYAGGSDWAQNYLSGNTISGNLHIKNNQSSISINGKNTISGGFSATTNAYNGRLSKLYIGGYNTINGNLSQLVVPSDTLAIWGNNQIVGNISDMNMSPQTNSFYIFNNGQNPNSNGNCIPPLRYLSPPNITTGNTITGNVSDFNPMISLGNLFVLGRNQLTGNIATLDIPSLNKVTIASTGNTVTATFTGSEWPVGLNSGYLVLYSETPNLITQGQVDNILSHYQGLNPAQPCILKLLGTGIAEPGPAGLAIKQTLNGQNRLVCTDV